MAFCLLWAFDTSCNIYIMSKQANKQIKTLKNILKMDITNKLSRVCEMNSTIWEAFKSSGFDCIIF